MMTAAFCLFTLLTCAQPGKIEVTFIGNCGFFLTDGRVNLYVDFPYKSGAHGYMTYDSRALDTIRSHSVFLFTHGHSDHYSRKLFKRTDQKLYGPWPVEGYLAGKRKYSLKALNDSMAGFSVREYRTKHGFSLKHLSYLLTWNGRRIFISGDAETCDTACSLKNLDLVIGPVWLIQDSKKRGLKIDTKKIIISHHRNSDLFDNQSKDLIVIPTQGQTVSLK